MTTTQRINPGLSAADGSVRKAMTPRTLWAFFALAFLLGWGPVGLLMIFPDQIVALFGEVGYTNPMFIFAVYSPAIAGVLLVWRHYGVHGLGSFLRRLGLWRMPIAWWALLIVGIPAVKYVGAALTEQPRSSRSIRGTASSRRWPSRC